MPKKPLVLITRTRPAAKKLADKVVERGFEAWECPPFQLEPPLDPAAVADDLSTLLPADRVILTSHEAVRQAVALVGTEKLGRALLIVPGQGTSEVARKLGLKDVFYPERHGTSEAMLAMPELRDVDGLDILILAAAGGRGLMGRALDRRGALVERIHVYRRVPCDLPEGTSERILEAESLAILGASLESVTGLLERLSDEAAQKVRESPIIVPSQRIAARAVELGCTHCIVAAGASDDFMLKELEHL